MVDELHIHVQNRTMNPHAVALGGIRRELSEDRVDGRGNLINVQCKALPL
jgi:hypothetical protein